MEKRLPLLAAAILALALFTAADANHLAAFSDPSRIWGDGVERVLEEAFRAHFRTRIIGGRVMNIRMPFAMNDERSTLLDTRLDVVAGGKGNPETLWPIIERMLDSDDFAYYIETLSDGREQVIIFDLQHRTWESSRDFNLIARMRAGQYPGLPHRPHVLVSGNGVSEADVYNYLYSIGRIGVDCSGFVWNVLVHVARRGGLDMARMLGPSMGVRRGVDPAWYAGTVFFNSRNPNIVPVEDRIANLRPADVMLFRGPDGQMSHSAIIQSIDFTLGVIRYLQSTDMAQQEERGVHESFVHFDPARTYLTLCDPSHRWTKQRRPAFIGEPICPFANDGERYRAFAEFGGGRVVRLRFVSQLRFAR
ncbi:MAG: peptidoglycan endopeptidase [Treponema sp.]|nr:peptidoglycan endopeptidase [Treponema sp.]